MRTRPWPVRMASAWPELLRTTGLPRFGPCFCKDLSTRTISLSWAICSHSLCVRQPGRSTAIGSTQWCCLLIAKGPLASGPSAKACHSGVPHGACSVHAIFQNERSLYHESTRTLSPRCGVSNAVSQRKIRGRKSGYTLEAWGADLQPKRRLIDGHHQQATRRQVKSWRAHHLR